MTKQAEITNDPRYKPVLDHGFVGLVDIMGDDSSIVQAARVSYGKGTKQISEDRGLIRYLMRHEHTTPLEMVEFKFHCKIPIFVARQWIRHRTASVNEYSGRYSEMVDEFYSPYPEDVKPQSSDNKQGRSGSLSYLEQVNAINKIDEIAESSYKTYEFLLGKTSEHPGIAKELARIVLPVNNYTEWYWKIDLKNLFHFLKLRMDPHAQYEIRVFAEAMYELIKPYVPIACEAFEDYVLGPNKKYGELKLSTMEFKIIKELFNNHVLDLSDNTLENHYGLSKREIVEFRQKFGIY